MITQKELKELFFYNEDDGRFTRRVATTNSVKVGDVAGGFNQRGYVVIWTKGRSYLAHRLAWLYVYGEFPELNIDHINHDITDNRISNLREATQLQNVWNSKIKNCSETGVKGITRDKRRSSTFYARCRVNGKPKFLGVFSTKEEAGKAYEDFAKSLHGNFYAEPI